MSESDDKAAAHAPSAGEITAVTVVNPTREQHTTNVRHDGDGQVEPPTSVEVQAPTRGTGGSLVTPEDALDVDEVIRLRGFALFAAFASAPFAFLLLLFARGDEVAKVIHVAGLLFVFVGFGYAVVRLRDQHQTSPGFVAALGMTGLVAVGTGLYYWGRFAPILLIVPIALYVFALGRSGGAAAAVCVVAVLMHLVLTVLAMTGWVPDVGLLHPERLSRVEDVGIALWVESLFVGITILGRQRRQRSLEGLNALKKAVREIAKREALLDEAKAELDRALRVRIPGRFTGQVFAGYELGVLIGKGGIGEVYEAHHLDSGALAAVKLLSRSSLSDSDLVNRFYRELAIASELSTDHVVKVLAVSDDDTPVPFLVMELLSGETLGDRLRHVGRLTLSEVVELVDQVCEAVDVAHDSGIVHRDLKPRNLFYHLPLDGRGLWKVLDFGVSKLAGSQTITRGQVVGTPNYMSPEQAMGREVDPRADVFSIGVIAYRCLTGLPAFSGPDVPSVLYAVVHTMPAQPSRVAEMPAEVDDVLAIAMAKNAADRFESCSELAEAFRHAVDQKAQPAIAERARTLLSASPWRPVSEVHRRATDD